jgi:hypothetical protein
MPGPSPLPARLDDAVQKSIDDSWSQALTPVNHLDHQALLDTLLFTQAYQFGVDKVSFRSEKKVNQGTVVMEIEFDRLNPDQDRFEVTVLGPNQAKVRQEKYQRKEIEDTCKAFSDSRRQDLTRKEANGTATREELKELEHIKGRVEAVARIFPAQQEKAKSQDPANNR